jgi:Cu2+-containing amine oxidase
VELRFVDYRGKRVLYRGHVPILNVKYDNNACGPYLDWQFQEGMLEATGTDVAPGFRLCPTPARTMLDTGNDSGNFLGVGIYVQGQEVVLVSEMEAGWYRYISEWRLATDGTIRPRFGFGAVTSSCVCTRHYHYPYWRMDFDIRTAGRNVIREFNDPPLYGSSKWHVKRYEIQRPRNPAHKRRWRVQNVDSGEAYDVVPGGDDGVATASPDWPFPQGDVWFTRYRAPEIDTGVVATGPPFEANIGNFVSGEVIENEDVVVWYAGHATHDVAAEEPGHFGHVVGPELRPVNW